MHMHGRLLYSTDKRKTGKSTTKSHLHFFTKFNEFGVQTAAHGAF